MEVAQRLTDTETSVAVGVPVFRRTEALQRCLESITGSVVDRAIVADNGRTTDREQLYARDWEFELTVLQLEYNSGIGACRAAIADELTEDYLIVVDNDMIMPPSPKLRDLQTVLQYDEDLGGVSGILVEQDRIRSGCSNLHEEHSLFGNKFIVHSIRTEPIVEWIGQTLPIARFDMITNAAMLRHDCIEDYSWDSRYPMREHLDFYIGHYHRTDWEFAVCPAVVFNHEKGRYPKYRTQIRGGSDHYEEMNKTVHMLNSEKWGYHRIEYEGRQDWIDTTQKSIPQEAYRILNRKIPIEYTLPLKDAFTRISGD